MSAPFPGEPVLDQGGPGTIYEAARVRATLVGKTPGALMPRVGQEVLGVVTRIRQQAANVRILAVGGKALHGSLSGSVRLQDIRKHDIDKLSVSDCFRPGDVVKARVLSLGDSRAYFLTTAEPELGVVVAYADDGAKLLPLSWEHMVDPRSGRREPRKVAKPLVLIKG